MGGLYIHIPFCRRKCWYCDFYSVGAKNAPWGEYVQRLLEELRQRKSELIRQEDTQTLAGRYREADPGRSREAGLDRGRETEGRNRDTVVGSVYIGGGTPSGMPGGVLERLLAGVRRELGEAYRPVEVTMEVNPEDVSASLVQEMVRAGVNRVSMGVQTLQDEELRAVGRRHTAGQALRAYGLLREIGNASLDIMFGLPGQTRESFADTLARIISLRPEHISAYSLMLEPGTAFTRMREQGRLPLPSEQDTLWMYAHLREELERAGYRQYEVSNFALPGRESRHNSTYWDSSPYLGLGAGAHSFDGHRTRLANPSDLKKYLAGAQPEIEILTPQERDEEILLTRLRTVRGLDLKCYPKKETLMRKAAPYLQRGCLRLEGERLFIPAERFMMLDSILVDLI